MTTENDELEPLDPEEAKEEPKPPKKWYFTIHMGQLDCTVESEAKNPSMKAVLADAMGITAGMIFIDEVYVIESEYWSRNKIGVGFHVGANSKAHLLAEVHWTQY